MNPTGKPLLANRPDLIARAGEMYSRGVGLKEIAAALRPEVSCCLKTIGMHLNRRGLNRRTQRDAKIRRLRARGWDVEAISEETGASLSAVYTVLGRQCPR